MVPPKPKLFDITQFSSTLSLRSSTMGMSLASGSSFSILAEAATKPRVGSPTYFVDGDMFYGQDHLEMVEGALRQPFAGNWPRA